METQVAELNNILAFIRESPPGDFRMILDAVRAVKKGRLREMRKHFKQGDQVEWTVKRRAGVEYFKGQVVRVNSTTCDVMTDTELGCDRYWRVPFAFLRHVDKLAKS